MSKRTWMSGFKLNIHAAEVKEIVSTYEQEVMKRLDSPTSTEQQ